MCSSIEDLFVIFRDEYKRFHNVLVTLKTDSTLQVEALEVLEDMLHLINKFSLSKSNDVNRRMSSMVAVIKYYKSCVLMEVKDFESCEEVLFEAMNLVRDEPFHPYNFNVVVGLYNQLGIMYSHLSDLQKSLQYLKKSENMFKDFTKNDLPLSYYEVLTNSNYCEEYEEKDLFNSNYKRTIYFLAQVFRLLDETINAEVYCFKTLNLQLKDGDLDKVDWALNAATLSQVFVESNAFQEARHLLAAADHVIDTKQNEVDSQCNESFSEELAVKQENLKHRKSDIARCWTKYCINLLQASKSRLVEDNTTSPSGALCGLKFEDINVTSVENEIPGNYCLTYDDALKVFQFGKKCAKKASEYYTLNDFASEYVKTVVDESDLIGLLLFFEEDESRQFKMQKKRIALLKNIADSLHPAFYIDILRDLWYSMGEIFMAMMELKSNEDLISSKKNNDLIAKAIFCFDAYINSFDKPGKKESSTKYPSQFESDVLKIRILKAKILSKFTGNDVHLLLQKYKEALHEFEEIVDYIQKYNSNALSSSELNYCKEFMKLLPLRMGKLSQSLL